MLIKRRAPHHLTEQDVTPEAVYQDRRLILKGLGLGAATLAFPTQAGVLDLLRGKEDAPRLATKPLNSKQATRPADLVLTPEEKATSYNNFYELGTDKTDPARNAHYLKPEPWTLKVEGEVANPFTLDVWDLINKTELEERIYRLRCVEAWSMVLPWNGISLAEIIRRAEPTSRAKFVAFETLFDPKQLPGQASASLGGGIDYPYVEGLRIDEAMHPLSFLAMGLYGKTLPAQKRGANPAGGAVEVRLQEHQEHRLDPLGGGDAVHHLESARPQRIWLLRQRQPAGGSPALESGQRAVHRRGWAVRCQAPADSDVQRLW